MTFDQRPPAQTLRRRLALATKGARLALANGVAKMLGLKLQAYEPQRPLADLTPRPARIPPPVAPKPAPKPASAPEPAGTAAAAVLTTPPERAAPPPSAPAVPDKAPVRPDRFAPDAAFAIHIDACTVCGDPLAELVKDDYCPKCNSPARTRALPPLLDMAIGPAVTAAEVFDLPMLGFAMTGVEKQLTAQVFPVQKSVSLFGNYGGDHEIGVDARDLSRYADGSMSGHFSILLFDYFTEQEAGVGEAFRVLAPGGVFFTQLGPYRLLDGWDAPFQIKEVRGRPGYFEYLPEGVALADIRVGRQWFLQAMEDAGFAVQWIRAHDRATGADLDWFVGYKPR